MKILLVGACGKMGTCVAETVAPPDKIVCGIDRAPKTAPFPVYQTLNGVREKADVCIDFSSPDNLEIRLAYCTKKRLPVVLACTGFSAQDEELIEYYARHITIFKSENFSVGVNLLCFLAKIAAETCKQFDAEIIEKHHNQKKDAPSGTALLLAKSINDGFGGTKRLVFGRSGTDAKRANEDIGIHSVRGGAIVGEHEILLAGGDETITLSHSALSRKVFASGALKAAAWSLNRPAGVYGMSDMLEL